MVSNNFKDEFNKTKNKIKWGFRIIIGFMILTILGYIGIGMWTINSVNTNGGVQKTITDIVRTIKQIDKDSDVK